MKVKWTECYTPSDIELDWFPDEDWSECDKHYEGEVIGTNHSFWHGNTVTVACSDGKIRSVSIKQVGVVKEKDKH
jgi:hypothetical protein